MLFKKVHFYFSNEFTLNLFTPLNYLKFVKVFLVPCHIMARLIMNYQFFILFKISDKRIAMDRATTFTKSKQNDICIFNFMPRYARIWIDHIRSITILIVSKNQAHNLTKLISYRKLSNFSSFMRSK